MTLQELKKNVLNDRTLNLSLVEMIGIYSCDNKEYIQKVIEKYQK
jgi:hypothetical protein